MSDFETSLSDVSSTVILTNVTITPAVFKTSMPMNHAQKSAPRNLPDDKSQGLFIENPEDIQLPDSCSCSSSESLSISDLTSDIVIKSKIFDDEVELDSEFRGIEINKSRSPSPLGSLRKNKREMKRFQNKLTDTRISSRLRRSGSLFKPQYTWSLSSSHSQVAMLSPLSSINSECIESSMDSVETPNFTTLASGSPMSLSEHNSFFKPNLNNKSHRLAFNSLTSPAFTRRSNSVSVPSPISNSISIVSNPRVFGVESTTTGNAGSVGSSNTILPFSILSIITSRPRHLYHSLKNLSSSNYCHFWSLDNSEKSKLMEWNKIEFKIQQKLFNIYTILKKFRYEIRRLTDYYGPEFAETDIVFAPKIQESKHQQTFVPLSSLADQFDYLVEEKLKPAYDETMLVNDEYILLETKVWFEEVEHLYFNYASSISLLSKLTTDQKVSDWIKIAEETDMSLITNPSVVSGRVLMSCYFLKLFTPLIFSLQELSTLYQISGNDYMMNLTNDIICISGRLNNMTDYTTTRESLSDLMTDQSTDIEFLEDTMFSESPDILSFENSDFASFWKLEGNSCKTLFSAHRLQFDVQSKMLQFYVLLDGIRWDIRHIVKYYGKHFKYTSPIMSSSDISEFIDDDFYDNTFGKINCLYESIDAFLSGKLSNIYDNNLFINDKYALEQSIKWFNQLEDTINFCSDSISYLVNLASFNMQFQESLIKWNQLDDQKTKFSMFKDSPVDIFRYYFVEFLNPIALTIYDLRKLYFETGDSTQFNLSEDLYSSITNLNEILDPLIRKKTISALKINSSLTSEETFHFYLPANIRLMLSCRTLPQLHNMDYFDGLQYSEFWCLTPSECRNFCKWDKQKYEIQNRIFEFYLVLKRIRINFKRMVEFYAPEFQNARGLTPTYSTDYQDVFVPLIIFLNKIEKLVNIDLKPYYDNSFFVNDREILAISNEWFKKTEADHFDKFAKQMAYLQSLSQDPNVKLWLGRVSRKDIFAKNNRYATDANDLFSRYFLSFLTSMGLLIARLHQVYEKVGDDDMTVLTKDLLDCVTRLNEACDSATK